MARTKAVCLPKKKTAKKKTTKKKTTSSVKSSAAPASKKKSTKKSSKKVAKKTTKKVAKKVTKKVAKKVTKKKVTKKKVVKKPTKKISTKKTPTKKSTKKSAKKTSKKSTAQPAAKKSKKKVTKKTAAKKVVKKTASKSANKTTKPAAAKPTAAASTPAAGAKPADTKAAQPVRKKTRSSKAKKKPLVLPDRPLLLGPNGPSLKPLIATGSKVQKHVSVLDNVTSRRTKTPLTKTQLDSYRMILLQKRAELLGDMRHLEEEALGAPGSVNTKSKSADEQGSESYEQSLSLNLAASDRKLINEIDDALKRIVDRTYGLCELTYEPIKKARLDVLPWARYTIDAAREVDRRGGT